MQGDFEKMVVLSSTTNEWPKNHIDEKALMASTGSIRAMEKPTQDHQQQNQQQQQPLKCPRCDSSNTKFCYYNNYSLSQPRHFCKACKRYWTRGGTLRNVPVGGGCRKNKRVKRPASSASEAASLSSASPAATNTNHPTLQPHVDLSSTSTHLNPMFFGIPTNPSELNLPYPRLSSGFDHLQHQVNVLGLGFSSRLLGSGACVNNESYRNGFNSTKQIQDGNGITSNPVFSSYPIRGSSTSSNSTTSTLASLIASSLQQQKLVSSGFKDMQGGNNFQGLLPLENLQMANLEGGMMMMKEMKMEGGGQSRLDWNNIPHNNQNHHQIEQINSSSDPASLWNITSGSGVGAWLHDPSVPSLI